MTSHRKPFYSTWYANCSLHSMAQHKLRSRIAQFKQPFLVGAVTSAAFLSGCGGETQGTGTSDECPTQVPKSAQTCGDYEPGLECVYDDDSSCSREFRCNDGSWENISPSCNPPPPDPIAECPKVTPASGAACDVYEPGLDCAYNDDSGCQLEFTCTSDAWEDVSPTCNPPPPEVECPDVTPTSGSACDDHKPGLDCAYDDESSCPREFTCDDGAWEDVSPTCNPPPPELECPQLTPTAGQACMGYEPGLDCAYDEESSCPREFTCSVGAWEDVSPSCNPPPPETECPEQSPSLGDSCEEFETGLECESDTEDTACPEASVFVCGSSGDWEGPVVTCNPPAVVETDGGVDSGVDARVDSGVIVGVDSGVSIEADSGLNSAVDAGGPDGG